MTVRHDRSRELLVADYLPHVRAIAFRYRGFGLALDDLVQEGSLGLLDAIDRYDVQRGPNFEAYAHFCIRRAIRNALTDQSRLIRLPKQVVERRRAIERAESTIKNATGRTATPTELAAETGLPPAAVVAARVMGATPISLDQALFADGSALDALVADGTACDPEAAAVEHEEIEAVDDAVSALSDRQRAIVCRHFGIGRDAEEIADVAADLHVSQQRARTIERDALYALRDRLDPAVAPSDRQYLPRTRSAAAPMPVVRAGRTMPPQDSALLRRAAGRHNRAPLRIATRWPDPQPAAEENEEEADDVRNDPCRPRNEARVDA